MPPLHLLSKCKDLLSKLLDPNPSQHLTVEGIYIKHHPFFCKGLPSGALAMTAEFLHAPSSCRQSEEKLLAVLAEAVGVLEASTNLDMIMPQADVTLAV
jgi:hypothetical protein